MKKENLAILKNKTVNYLFYTKPDDAGKYRLTVVLNENDIKELERALKAAGWDEYLPLDLLPGDKITPKSSYQPEVEIMAELEDVLYSGMVADIAINAFEYSYKRKCGISWGLVAIRKVEDGERLDCRLTAHEIFSAGDEPGLSGGEPW